MSSPILNSVLISCSKYIFLIIAFIVDKWDTINILYFFNFFIYCNTLSVLRSNVSSVSGYFSSDFETIVL